MCILEYIGKIDSCYNTEGGISIGDVSFSDIVRDIETTFVDDEIIYVSYLISDVKLNKEQFLENRLLYIFGATDVECYDVYGSELTGYMWTEQKFEIGGHNLLEEIISTDGKYCYLKIYGAVENRNLSIEKILNDK